MNSWRARKGDLHRAFPLDVPMVPSSMIAITVDDEHLTCGGFSLGETIYLGNFEFIADYFGGLSLSPARGDIGITFMGSTSSGAPTQQWAMIEDPPRRSSRHQAGRGASASPFGEGTV
jgi:hypothetical protein